MNAMLDAMIVAARIHRAVRGAAGEGQGAARMTPASHGDAVNVVIYDRPYEPSSRSNQDA
jgi:hypothetical protein